MREPSLLHTRHEVVRGVKGELPGFSAGYRNPVQVAFIGEGNLPAVRRNSPDSGSTGDFAGPKPDLRLVPKQQGCQEGFHSDVLTLRFDDSARNFNEINTYAWGIAR